MRVLAPAVLLACAVGCRGPAEAPAAAPVESLGEVSPAAWRALGRARIYFGHQSVGAGLMQGVREIVESHLSIALRVVPYQGAAELTPGTLAHGHVGRNLDYVSKIDGFVELVEGELGGRGAAGGGLR